MVYFGQVVYIHSGNKIYLRVSVTTHENVQTTETFERSTYWWEEIVLFLGNMFYLTFRQFGFDYDASI